MNYKKFALIFFVSLLATCIKTSVAQATNAGDLDIDFDTDGKVTTAITRNINSIAVQSDGKIVAGGQSSNGSSNFVITRYDTDGSLDTSFGVNGIVTTTIGSTDNVINSIAIQSDGMIVAGGYSDNGDTDDFALARYTTTGTLDVSFDNDGMVTTVIGSGGRIQSLAIQSDGKIVAGGFYNNGNDQDFALARYTTTGTLDTSFDTDGMVTTTFGSLNDQILSIIIQSDGKIVAGGHASISDNTDFALARYSTNGSLDTSFDTDGMVTTTFGSNIDGINSISFQSDGKIVAGGYENRSFSEGIYDNFALARYNSTDGSLDTSFGVSGKVTTTVGSTIDVIRSVAIQSDDKIIAAGYYYNYSASKYSFALARYSTNGTLDTDFGSSGVVTTSFSSGTDQAYSATLQSDGKIVLGGFYYNGSTFNFALARYLANGIPATPEFDIFVYLIAIMGAGWFIVENQKKLKGAEQTP